MSHQGRVELLLLLVAIGTAVALSGVRTGAQPNPYPPNPYRLVEDWAPQLPAHIKLGQVVAADPGPDGNIYVVHRCGAENCIEGTAPPILKLDSSGRLLKSWGDGMMVWPHGAGLDPQGNIWVTDAVANNGVFPKPVGAKGHQVFKFDPDGKLLMTLGTAGVAGNGPNTFNAPTDVAVSRNGDIYVSDGHGPTTNARIVKFSKDGKFVKAWGTRGTGRDNLDSPHSIVVDSISRVYVADRTNNRVMVYDSDGNVLAEWRQFGRPSGLFIDKNDMMFVTDTQTTEGRPGWRNGIYVGSVKDGKVTAFIPKVEPISNMEGVGGDAAGIIYGAESGGQAIRKFVKR